MKSITASIGKVPCFSPQKPHQMPLVGFVLCICGFFVLCFLFPTFASAQWVAGDLYTYAGAVPGGYSGDGGPAVDAQMYNPRGLAMDSNGNLYIGDDGNYVVRKVSTSGIISTFAGTGTAFYEAPTVSGVPATSTNIGSVDSIAVDSNDNVYIA